MTTYKASVGVDVATLDLVTIVPQPSSQGIQFLRRVPSASGAIVEHGMYCELEFNVLEDVTMYQALLTQFGILSSQTAAVTILVRSEILSFVRYNGIAIRPETGKDISWSYFPRNVTILIKNLEQLVEV